MRTFASDNSAPAAQEILEAIARANEGDAVAYGDDACTQRAVEQFAELFGEDADVYFTFNGTGANVIALSAVLKPYEAVITPASAHLQTDECGAFERFSGSKILPVHGNDGKIRAEDLRLFAGASTSEHHSQPRAVSISQSTEYGTLYDPDELRDLCRFAHECGWYVHMDGARIANAAAALGLGLRECTRDLGVDVLTFGGTKNGLLFGEAVVFFEPKLHHGAMPYVRKQGMQLASKMRFIAAQFSALLEEKRWHTYAAHANVMARRLEERVRGIEAVRITRPVQCNAVFATLPHEAIAPLQEQFAFYVFDKRLPEVRWMTHHATTPEDVDRFAECVARETAR